ncbi:Tripartite tricarboxylate transporter family receptor [Xylophilus ampelinus]|nr:tripartite tricarboxylate transporter substrate binding protein [Variovorax sp.]VTY31585.1 Tripartite tricarboxylate transporter family receptor [Xylophilus ampelinus]
MLAALALLPVAGLRAQTPAAHSPPDVVRVVVGYVPGGSLDAVARLTAAEMATTLRCTLIVENRPGANGNIAAEYVARAAPDGGVMLATFNTHPLIAALYPHLKFDPVDGFRPVGMIAQIPYVLVARPDLPGATLTEVITTARSSGRVLSYATVGAGSPQHLSIERFKASAHLPVTVVHYKGGAPAQQDVQGGHVDMMLSTVALALPQVQAGNLKALAVSSPQRLAALPQTPTLHESGNADFVGDGWFGMLLPAKTPDAITQRYNEALNRALAAPHLQQALTQMGATPAGGTTQSMAARMSREREVWTRVIQANGIRTE